MLRPCLSAWDRRRSTFTQTGGWFVSTRGFFADGLLQTLKCLPEHLWPETRRKKDYLNGVLARAEIESGNRPARKLWKRGAVGYFMPAPDMKLRRKTADGEAWIPIAEALDLAAVSDGGEGGFVIVMAGRLRVAQHARVHAAIRPRGRATRPMPQSVSACRLGG
jgi:hypothetical protein